jgi:hypothetical protein
MFFHITMTHKPEDCPAYFPPDKQKEFFLLAENMPHAAREKGIDILFFITGVGHIMYALVEATDFNALNSFFGGMQIKQDFQVEPVGHIKDVISAFKEELGKK